MLDLSLRVLLCAGLSAALGGAVLAFGHHERDVGRAEVRAQWDAAKVIQAQTVATAQAHTINTDRQRTAKAVEVDHHVQEQNALLVADRARVVRRLGGLLDELAAVRADALSSTTTRARLAAEASALADGLTDCSQRYSAVAGERDSLAVQTAGLIALLPPE
jgi:hypothetical protein